MMAGIVWKGVISISRKGWGEETFSHEDGISETTYTKKKDIVCVFYEK